MDRNLAAGDPAPPGVLQLEAERIERTERTTATSPWAICSRPLRRSWAKPARSSTARCVCTVANDMSEWAADAPT